MFIAAVMLLVGSVVAFIKCSHKFVGFVALFFCIACAAGSALYTQDVGEVAVLRNLGGSVAGSTSQAGFHVKAPWQDVIKYDIRNNVISFVGDGTEDYAGGSARGPQVTVNDSGGAKADIDIQVNYSIDPSIAETLYADYGTQESFVQKVVAVDVRSVPREIAGKFGTLDILTNRSEFADSIEQALSEKWSDLGLNVEEVTIQEVRYSDDIVNGYSDAQVAEVAQQEAKARQETAKINAETKVVEAEGEARANSILNDSLTSSVLQQKYIDAISELGKSGNLVVITDGETTPLIDVSSSDGR